jgi:hypothetical protein
MHAMSSVEIHVIYRLYFDSWTIFVKHFSKKISRKNLPRNYIGNDPDPVLTPFGYDILESRFRVPDKYRPEPHNSFLPPLLFKLLPVRSVKDAFWLSRDFRKFYVPVLFISRIVVPVQFKYFVIFIYIRLYPCFRDRFFL